MLNRRQFLQALAGLGAAIVIPVHASSEAVERAWSTALRKPWYFTVGDFYTLVDPDVEEPKTRSDVFDRVCPAFAHTPETLVTLVQGCPPLCSRFEQLSEDATEEWLAAREDEWQDACADGLDDDDPPCFVQPDVPWHDSSGWILYRGKAAVTEFQGIVRKWLDEPVDWSESEYFPLDFGGQGTAYQFFRDQVDADVRDELGVIIVEGDCPGSSYFAAELRADIDDANAAAARLGLPIRFRQAGV